MRRNVTHLCRVWMIAVAALLLMSMDVAAKRAISSNEDTVKAVLKMEHESGYNYKTGTFQDKTFAEVRTLLEPYLQSESIEIQGHAVSLLAAAVVDLHPTESQRQGIKSTISLLWLQGEGGSKEENKASKRQFDRLVWLLNIEDNLGSPIAMYLLGVELTLERDRLYYLHQAANYLAKMESPDVGLVLRKARDQLEADGTEDRRPSIEVVDQLIRHQILLDKIAGQSPPQKVATLMAALRDLHSQNELWNILGIEWALDLIASEDHANAQAALEEILDAEEFDMRSRYQAQEHLIANDHLLPGERQVKFIGEIWSIKTSSE